MDSNWNSSVIFAAISISVFGYFILRTITGNGWALFIAVTRPLVSLIYFIFFFSTSNWTILDDFMYEEKSWLLPGLTSNPLALLFNRPALDLLSVELGTSHIVYFWWNYLGHFLFGTYYFSPVFLNIGLTFIAARILYSTARQCDLPQNYSKYLAIYFVLHQELIAWSSFLNIKDTMVLTFSVLCFYCIIRLINARKKAWLILCWGLMLGGCFWIFTMLRYYVPVLIVGAVGFWLILGIKGKMKYFWLICSALAFRLVLPEAIPEELITTNIAIIAYDSVRFSLMPLPWYIGEGYTFENISAIYHWILFIPALIGGFSLGLRHRKALLLVLYSFVIIGFYAMVRDLAGDRQRFQICFSWAWMEFHFLWFAFAWSKVTASTHYAGVRVSVAAQTHYNRDDQRKSLVSAK